MLRAAPLPALRLPPSRSPLTAGGTGTFPSRPVGVRRSAPALSLLGQEPGCRGSAREVPPWAGPCGQRREGSAAASPPRLSLPVAECGAEEAPRPPATAQPRPLLWKPRLRPPSAGALPPRARGCRTAPQRTLAAIQSPTGACPRLRLWPGAVPAGPAAAKSRPAGSALGSGQEAASYHRITELEGCKGPPEIIQLPPKAGSLQQVTQESVRTGSECLQGTLHSLCRQYSVSSSFVWNFPCSGFCPLPLTVLLFATKWIPPP